jgi:hypothetical protein
MKKLSIVILITIFAIIQSYSQGISLENKNDLLLANIETARPEVYQGNCNSTGFLQQSDSLTMKKQRFYYHGHMVKTNKELLSIMKTNRQANVKFQNSLFLRVAAMPLACFGGMGLGYSISNDKLEKSQKNKIIGISIGLAAAGITLAAISGVVQNKAIRIYNQGLNKTSYNPLKEIKIGFIANGIGVNYRF